VSRRETPSSITLWRSSLRAITGSPFTHQREAAFDPMASRTFCMSRGESTVVSTQNTTLDVGFESAQAKW
jgi:hypothetical protein